MVTIFAMIHVMGALGPHCYKRLSPMHYRIFMIRSTVIKPINLSGYHEISPRFSNGTSAKCEFYWVIFHSPYFISEVTNFLINFLNDVFDVVGDFLFAKNWRIKAIWTVLLNVLH